MNDKDKGEAIAALLDLKINKLGRIDTVIGDKSAIGLLKTIERVLEDPEFATALLKARI